MKSKLTVYCDLSSPDIQLFDVSNQKYTEVLEGKTTFFFSSENNDTLDNNNHLITTEQLKSLLRQIFANVILT